MWQEEARDRAVSNSPMNVVHGARGSAALVRSSKPDWIVPG